MEQIVIEAQRRIPAGKNANRRIRKAGRIPAVVYGAGKEALPLLVDPDALSDILHSQSGHNTIFGVSVDGGSQATVMVKDYQLDPVRGNIIHADLYEIAMDQLLKLTVDVEMIGEAEGVKLGGIMDVVTRSLEVECLPADIPKSIRVDVSPLQVNDYIRVKNLPADPKVRILSDPEVVIVTIVPPVKEEVPVEVAPAGPAEPEVIKKGKVAEEGEEGEEKGKAAKQPEKSKPESK